MDLILSVEGIKTEVLWARRNSPSRLPCPHLMNCNSSMSLPGHLADFGLTEPSQSHEPIPENQPINQFLSLSFYIDRYTHTHTRKYECTNTYIHILFLLFLWKTLTNIMTKYKSICFHLWPFALWISKTSWKIQEYHISMSKNDGDICLVYSLLVH